MHAQLFKMQQQQRLKLVEQTEQNIARHHHQKRPNCLTLALPDTTGNTTHLLEDPASARIRELSELVRLLESDLITLEEFNSVKRQLFQS